VLHAALDPRLLAVRLSCINALTNSLPLVVDTPCPVRVYILLDPEALFCTDIYLASFFSFNVLAGFDNDSLDNTTFDELFYTCMRVALYICS
jgi:hypothetical protein